MILILGSKADICLNMVLDWLDNFDTSYLIIDNSESILIEELNVSELKFVFSLKGQCVDYDDVRVVFNWRGALNIDDSLNVDLYRKFPSEIRQHLNYEKVVLRNFILNLLSKKDGVGNKYFYNPNKLDVLNNAMQCGLKIPYTFISSNKEKLKRIIKRDSINKPIGEKLSFVFEDKVYDTFTAKNKENYLEKREKYFFPSLIQHNISKAFELRVFFIDNQLYTLAFFSQESKDSIIDTRKINFSSPYRIVPYSLPKDLERKLLKLISILKIDTGSIDLIVTSEEDYIFLEINPWGYFNLHKEIGNYPIDFIIASKLKDLIYAIN